MKYLNTSVSSILLFENISLQDFCCIKRAFRILQVVNALSWKINTQQWLPELRGKFPDLKSVISHNALS